MLDKLFKILFYIVLIVASSCSASKTAVSMNKDEKIIPLTIGTYTKETSEGIYQADFNIETGEISDLKLIVKAVQPSFIALTKDKEKMYAVSEIDEGKLSLFHQQKDGSYLLNQEISTEGSTTCHVTLNKDESLISVANYRKGSVTVYRLEDDKLLKAASFKHQGSSVHYRQKVPHPHSTYFSNDEKYIYAPDLGTDKIMAYPIIKGVPAIGTVALKMTPGDGPRHMVAHPTENLWFVVAELSSVVWTLRPKEDGTFEVIDKQKLLPNGLKERSTAADIHVSPNGKYLYTSSRGHKDRYHCITVFKIEESGKLEFQGRVTDGINQPRNFSLSPNGKFLLVANQYGDDVIVFKVKENGMLVLTEHAVKLSMPACLKF